MPPLLLHEIVMKGKPLYYSHRDILTRMQMYSVKAYDDIAFLTKCLDWGIKIKPERMKNVTKDNQR